MSAEGVKLAANVFAAIQQAREQLIRMGTQTETVKTPSGHQDVLLGQMLDKAKDAIKDEFIELTDMKGPIVGKLNA